MILSGGGNGDQWLIGAFHDVLTYGLMDGEERFRDFICPRNTSKYRLVRPVLRSEINAPLGKLLRRFRKIILSFFLAGDDDQYFMDQSKNSGMSNVPSCSTVEVETLQSDRLLTWMMSLETFRLM